MNKATLHNAWALRTALRLGVPGTLLVLALAGCQPGDTSSTSMGARIAEKAAKARAMGKSLSLVETYQMERAAPVATRAIFSARSDSSTMTESEAKSLEMIKELLAAESYYEKSSTPQEYARAAELWKHAAQLGNGTAKNNLAVMYIEGKGVPTDRIEARKLFESAISTRSNLMAKANLGLMLAQGGEGITRDLDAAENLLQDPAKFNEIAAENLAAIPFLRTAR